MVRKTLRGKGLAQSRPAPKVEETELQRKSREIYAEIVNFVSNKYPDMEKTFPKGSRQRLLAKNEFDELVRVKNNIASPGAHENPATADLQLERKIETARGYMGRIDKLFSAGPKLKDAIRTELDKQVGNKQKRLLKEVHRDLDFLPPMPGVGNQGGIEFRKGQERSDHSGSSRRRTRKHRRRH